MLQEFPKKNPLTPTTLDKKLKKEQYKKLKNENINRRRRRGKQEIYEASVPVHEKTQKVKR